MAVVKELLRAEADGSISFGNYELPEKAKLNDFKHEGDILKIKTYKDITKLEKNEMFAYESVPGTTVTNFKESDTGVEFSVEGDEDAQITLGLEENAEYAVIINDSDEGRMKTNLGGKLNISVELSGTDKVSVKVEKI